MRRSAGPQLIWQNWQEASRKKRSALHGKNVKDISRRIFRPGHNRSAPCSSVGAGERRWTGVNLPRPT